MPALTRKHVVLAKLETTKGTDSSPGASDAVQVYEPTFDGPNLENLELEYAAADLDTDPSQQGLASGSMTFKTTVRGSGNKANASEADPLFQAAGCQKADVGELDHTRASGRFVLGQQISDATTGAEAIILYPQDGNGTVRVAKLDATAFTAPNVIDIDTGPSWIQSPVVAGSGYAATGHGYRPVSDEWIQHDLAAAYTPGSPSVGALVIYTDATTLEVVAAGILRSIQGSPDRQQVELYMQKPGRAIAATDVCTADGNTASVHGTPALSISRSPSLTLHSYLDTIRRTLLGSHGTFSLDAESGRAAAWEWNFQGTPGNPADGSPPAGISYPATQGPRWVNGFAELNGVRFSVKRARFELGAGLVEELNANAATGSDGSIITSREPLLTLELKHAGVGTLDFFAAQRDVTTLVGGVVIGSTTGNIVSLVGPRLQVVGVESAEFDGVAGWSLQLRMRRRIGGENDSFYIDYQ